MGYHYYIIDAFSESAFGGVPVAVFPDATGMTEAMQASLASEQLAADTVFVTALTNGNHHLNAFHEGKPAMAGAHVMVATCSGLLKANSGLIDSSGRAHFQFEQGPHITEAFFDQGNRHYPYLISESVAPEIDRYVPEAADIAATIGLERDDIASARYSSLIVSCGKPYLMVPLKSYHALREAAFHNREWGNSSLPQSLVDSLLLFAPNTGDGGDFHARLLERGTGATADPAIGEAMPAFAAYLCEQKHVQHGTHSFTVRRGANNARQSHIHLEMDNLEPRDKLNLRIGGSAVVTSSAEILSEIAV